MQAVFVAATTNGWLFWNTDANPNTAEGAVMLTGKNSASNFGFGDLKGAMACGNGRQRRARQSRPGDPARTCLETEVPGTPEDFRCANLFQSKAMADLLAIGRDTLELPQRYQCFEPWIGS